MTFQEVVAAYDSPHFDAEAMLGTKVSPADPDRLVIEQWASTVSGQILDIGSGTGRWTGHLAARGHNVVGLEPAQKLIALSRRVHQGVEFRHGDLLSLRGTERRWAGLLSWYSLIHMGPESLPEALTLMRHLIEADGSFLMSFFTGPRLEAMSHPVATAYRWPLTQMTRALEQAGFELVDAHETSGVPHAHLVARPQSPTVQNA